MTEETTETAPPESASPLPEHMERFATELRAYYQALPRLLYDGEAGKHVVVRGETVSLPWDTYADGRQYASEKYPDGKYLVQKIDARMITALAPFFGPPPTEILVPWCVEDYLSSEFRSPVPATYRLR